MNTIGIVVLSTIIPLFTYYAFWRLKKLQKGLIITAIFSGIPFGLGMATGSILFIYIGGYFFSHSFSYFAYRWCRAWNKQIDLQETANSKSQNSASDLGDKS